MRHSAGESWRVARIVIVPGWGFCVNALLAQCAPAGYIKAADLERKEQGPSACATRCEELHMRMAALVLVGNELPGCVCQPMEIQPEKAASTANQGASSATASYAVMLAAAAAARQIEQQRQQQQQRMSTIH